MLLHRVASALDAGRPDQALEFLRSISADDPLLKNARGVCLLRLGRPLEALVIFRGLALDSDGFTIDPDQPTTFVTNLATALCLSGNVSGALSMLHELRRPDDAGVVRLRAEIARWRASFTRLERLRFWMYRSAPRPVSLVAPPGELVFPESFAPKRAA